ncbi:MAG: SAM-dependent chlorinase/fluorinase [Gammaproteobacteria bacterium]|nr:SAM-dependent chlorinase/fluorinase [Gammaproteobacteria bacterium]
MILLFTDFGVNDIYAGQVRAVLAQRCPEVPVVDLFHDAPAFNVRASARLLASLVERVPDDSIIMAVVDPGVGSDRRAIMVKTGRHTFVGPDNGLLALAARPASRTLVATLPVPVTASPTFHGRDLFAPVVAQLAVGQQPALAGSLDQLVGDDWDDDLAEIIYVDHYGNLVTGLKAGAVTAVHRLFVNDVAISQSRIFDDVSIGELMWYENSLGLVEIARNQGSAAAHLGAKIGTRVQTENQ